MKKLTLFLCLLLPILSKAQLYIANDADLYVSGSIGLYSGEQLYNYGLLTINSTDTVTLNASVTPGAYVISSNYDTGYIKSSSISNLTIVGPNTGTYKFYNIYFDQSTVGTTNVLKNLTIKGMASFATKNNLNITGGASPGTVIVGSNSLLYTNSYLYLKSNSFGTASIGTSDGTINGNITVERYIPANGKKYRFLASPVVGGTSTQWRDNGSSGTSGVGIHITGTGTGRTFDNLSTSYSAFYYDETVAGGIIYDYAKWISIDGDTTLTNGKGYRVFVRGDRTITTSSTPNNATTIWVKGNYPSNPVSLPLTYTAGGGQGSNQGFNLVGNPYPCAIDWDLVKAQSASNFSNMNDAIYTWHPSNVTSTGATNPSNGGYASYVGGIGAGSSIVGTRYISSSQAFFVKANASSPILKISEDCKVSAQQGDKMFKTTDEPSHIRLKLFADTIQLDDAVIHFTEGATKNFDGKYDAYDLTGGIGFLTADLKDTLAISGFPKLQVNDVAKINMFKQTTGNYKILFTDLSTFDEGFDAYLIDNFLNTNTLIKENSIYSFNLVDDNPFTYGNTRFEIVFALTNTSSENILNRKNETQLSVHPNPATDELNINLNNANFKNSNVNITNVSGQQIMNLTMNGANAKINIEGLSIGVYFVTITNENGFNQTVKFVK